MKEVKYVVVLTAISLVCAALLGAVFQVTAEPIKQAKENALKEGIGKVLPEGCTTDMASVLVVDPSDPNSAVIYPTLKDGKVVGAAIRAVSPVKGYGGDVIVMVGLNGLPDGEISVFATSVLDMSKETPGLGTKIAEPGFADQWKGIVAGKTTSDPDLKTQPFALKKDGGNVQAISGATFSSRAFTGCVNVAIKAWRAKGAEIVKGAENG